MGGCVRLELFDMKARYEESDNLVVRATRTVTDKMSELFGTLQHCLTFHALMVHNLVKQYFK